MSDPSLPKQPRPPEPAHCSNCGAPLRGPYCHRCGQEVRTRIAPIHSLAKDLLSELFNFDTRLFRTLRRLLFRPGQLTIEYIAGRRAGYVPPLRLFVFSSFILFLLLGILSTQTVQMNGSIAGTIDSLAARERAAADSTLRARGDSTVALALPDANPVQVSDTLVGMLTARVDSLRQTSTLRGQMEHALLRGLLRANRNPRLFMQQLVGRLSGLAFLLLPVFALLLKLFYVRTHRYYVEHLIFALHTHAFLFIILIVVTLAHLLGVQSLPPLIGVALFAAPGIHLFFGLRHVYGQGWIKTFVKWNLLLLSYLFLIVLAFSLYTALTFMLL